MIDRDHLEQAGLEALGLLDAGERAAFQREHRVNEELTQVSREMRDLVATIGATAPLRIPSPRNLDVILERIERGQTAVSEPVPIRSRTAFWQVRRAVPWAAAAGFALLAGWFAWQSHRTTQLVRQNRIPSANDSGASSQAPPPGSVDGHFNPALGVAPRERGGQGFVYDASGRTPSRFFDNRRGETEIRLEQDPIRLRAELNKLRAAEAARQELPTGVSDLRVVEMRPPGTTGSVEKRDLLSTRLAEAIATGISAPAAASTDAPATTSPTTSPPPEPVRLSGQGARASNDITIEAGMLNIGALNLHPDAQVIHQNFPRPEDFSRYGLVPLDADTAWDGHGGLWHRSADGRTWIGQKAPPNWQPPERDEPGSVVAPPLRAAPPPPTVEASNATSQPEASAPPAAQPYALPILDHNGQGTLIVQNLPPAPEGFAYHLWLSDPRFAEPINVGVLPPMESSNDHFGFDLGAPGFVPTGYLLTLEAKGASQAPRGKVVLQGP